MNYFIILQSIPWIGFSLVVAEFHLVKFCWTGLIQVEYSENDVHIDN